MTTGVETVALGNLEDRVSNLETIPRSDDSRNGHPVAVHIGPIDRTEVLNHELATSVKDPCVQL